MLLHEFYDFNYILKLPLKNITMLLIKAKLKDNDNKLYQQWIVNHSREFSFNNFKLKLKEVQKEELLSKIDKSKTEKEIMEEVENTLKLYRRSQGGEN